MVSKTNPQKQIALQSVLCVLLLYIVSIPFLYLIIKNGNRISDGWEIGIYALRFLCIIPIAFVIRKKHKDILSPNNQKSTSYYTICLLLAVIYMSLSLCSVPDDVYFAITNSIRLYDFKTTHFLFVLVVEQLFGKGMFFHMIACCVLVFAPIKFGIKP